MTVTNKNAYTYKGQRWNVYDFGITATLIDADTSEGFPLPAVFLHCNATASYRLYSDKNKYTEDKLTEGFQYAGPFYAITLADGSVVPDKAISVRF